MEMLSLYNGAQLKNNIVNQASTFGGTQARTTLTTPDSSHERLPEHLPTKSKGTGKSTRL